MFKLLTERKKRYWIVIGIIAIFTYGFLLANQSIGVDDENFTYYFDNYGIAMTGRYGYLLLMQLFNTYEYFPVWRDGIAVALLVLGSTFFVSLFQRLSNDNLSEDACIVFSGLLISYPLLGKMYVYISINIEVSLMLVLAAIAVYLTFRFFENRKIFCIIVTIPLLTLGISMIENCLNYYVTGIILGLWTIIIYENKRYYVPYDSQKKELIWIFKALLLCAIISVVSISIIPLARGPIFVWPEMIMRAKLCGYKWSNRKVTCHTHEMQSGSFGKPHDIIWGNIRDAQV